MRCISLIVDSNLALMTIDDPSSRANVFHAELLGELAETLHELEFRRDIKGLICRSGKPGMFIAGADLHTLADGSIAGERAAEFAREGQQILSRLERLAFPTACIIEGPALGGGLEFALCFDSRVVVDHPKTRLGLPETRLGLIPGWGGTQRLPRLAGVETGLEMIIRGQGKTPQEVKSWVERVCPADYAMIHAQSLIEELQQGAIWQVRRDDKYGIMTPLAQQEKARELVEELQQGIDLLAEESAMAKGVAADLISRTLTMDLITGLEAEAEAFARVAGSESSRRLIAEFFAARANPQEA